MNLDEKMKIVFLVCAGRAGSGFLHSLLDSHPQILMLPMELKFHESWERLGCDRITDAREMVRVWTESTKLVKLKTGIHYGFEEGKNNFTNCDVKLFHEKFEEYLRQYGLKRAKVFHALHRAYAAGIGQDISQVKVIIEFSASPKWIEAALEDFPKAGIIHVVRDFRANYASLKQHYINTRRGLVDFEAKGISQKIAVLSILQSLFLIRRINQLETRLNEHQIYHVRLEDLHHSLKETVDGVARWLGIQPSEILYESTLGGKPWLGNSAFGKSVQGVNTEVLNRWKQNLNLSEVLMINYFFKPELKQFHYESSEDDEKIYGFPMFLRWWLPFRNEFCFRLPKGESKIKGVPNGMILLLRATREILRYAVRLIFYPISRVYLTQLGVQNEIKRSY
ncbi:MAG: sulfotransferase [Candidatus Omnitrophica bacterium]|nr:sulfotransferase [Candidatus Omnitrophota bacterium]